jgi:predicted O-methyltransferase YrrM
MANQSLQLTKDMHCWLKNHACRPSTVMATLCKKTMELEQGEMLTSPEQLQFLAFLAKSIGAKNAIEVGVYTGASALAIAEVLPENGTIVACDLTEEFIPIASPAWKEAGVSNAIDLRIGPAIDTLNTLLDEGKANTFDFMYIDADKLNSRNYYELGLELVSSGGIIAIDNMFYGGQVIDDDTTDENTIATRELADFLVADNRIDYTLLPIGDGLALARVI